MASASTTKSSIPTLKRCNDSIYSFHDHDPPDHEITIIFFHDIQWSLEYEQPHIQTWMTTYTPGTPSVCWPKDWLREKFPKAKILSALYDGAMWKTNTTAVMTFYTVAENLMHDILLEYKRNSPIFLVGHGFGGIVIKKIILLMSESSPEPKLDSFLDNVKGVFYFATPFLGSRAADSTKDLPYRGPLLKFLEVFNPEVSQLNAWFSKCRRRRGFKAIAVSAALSTKVAVPLVWTTLQALLCRRRFTHIAAEGASRFDVDKFYTCHMDHFSICKLNSKRDSSFQQLISLIDPGTLNSTQEPVPHAVETAEVACTEFVEKITRQVAGQGIVFLPMRSIESKFLKVRIRLEEAGLKQRSLPIGPGVEMWGR